MVDGGLEPGWRFTVHGKPHPAPPPAHGTRPHLHACPLHAGAKERGELENRVTKLIAEIKEAGDVVLM